MAIPEHLEERLRRLTVGDEATLDILVRGEIVTGLDHKTSALVRIAALVALAAEGPSYQTAVDNAHAAGVEDREILEAVIAISPLVGVARLSSAIPGLIAALGIDAIPGSL